MKKIEESFYALTSSAEEDIELCEQYWDKIHNQIAELLKGSQHSFPSRNKHSMPIVTLLESLHNEKLPFDAVKLTSSLETIYDYIEMSSDEQTNEEALRILFDSFQEIETDFLSFIKYIDENSHRKRH